MCQNIRKIICTFSNLCHHTVFQDTTCYDVIIASTSDACTAGRSVSNINTKKVEGRGYSGLQLYAFLTSYIKLCQLVQELLSETDKRTGYLKVKRN